MSIILASNGQSITIHGPQYPIETEIKLSVHIVTMPDSSYRFWDDGAFYDYRICNIKKWQLPEAQQIAFINFLYNSSSARGNDITMTLSSGSGCFLFGPDLGDSGVFTVRVLSHDSSGLKMSPKRWFENEISLLLINKPAYTLPTSKTEGAMYIGPTRGGVTGIRQPQIESKPNLSATASTEPTRGGMASVVDRGAGNDAYTSEIEIQGTQSKMAEVVQFLTTIRGTSFDISTPYHYMFGTKCGKDGPWVSKLITDKLTIKHDSFNKFRLTGVKLGYVKE